MGPNGRLARSESVCDRGGPNPIVEQVDIGLKRK
jgi:hypothetical protein